jgi:phosphopantetheine adenylyltransferase
MSDNKKLNDMIDLIDEQWGIVVMNPEEFGAMMDDDEREAIITSLEDVARALRTVKARIRLRAEYEAS